MFVVGTYRKILEGIYNSIPVKATGLEVDIIIAPISISKIFDSTKNITASNVIVYINSIEDP